MKSAVPPLTLDQQLAAFRCNRFLAMPITGLIVWSGIGIAGAILPEAKAALATYLGTGAIFYLALLVAKFTGEDILGRQRPANFFDKIYLSTLAMSLLVFAVAIPFQWQNLSSVPLSVGVLTGLMWLPFSVIAGHWVGYFHTLVRTALLVVAWFLFPAHRFTILPAIIVAVYFISIIALARRWSVIKASSS